MGLAGLEGRDGGPAFAIAEHVMDGNVVAAAHDEFLAGILDEVGQIGQPAQQRRSLTSLFPSEPALVAAAACERRAVGVAPPRSGSRPARHRQQERQASMFDCVEGVAMPVKARVRAGCIFLLYVS